MGRPVLSNVFEEMGMESTRARRPRAMGSRRRGESMMRWATFFEGVVVAVAVVAVVGAVVVGVAAVFFGGSRANKTAMTAVSGG